MTKDKTKLFRILPLSVIGIGAVIISAAVVKIISAYNGHHKIEPDKTANINVMLTRPDNWEKLDLGGFTLNKENFSLIDGSTATIPITAELARQCCGASDDDIGKYIDHNTTGYAYYNLMMTARQRELRYKDNSYKQKNLIFATEPSVDEIKEAADCNIEYEVTPVALDGFVFITHKDNPVDSLTVQQIKDIYSGKITNWKEVGGNDSEIIPYQREANSGSQTAMEQLVMKDTTLMEPKEGYCIRKGMGELIEMVAEYENRENSLGYTYYYYINNLYKNDNIKVLKIDGISPDNENLRDKSYPFSTAYYVVTVKGDDSELMKLKDFIVSDKGQQIVKMAGYCTVNGSGE
ncbi:MAG: substrate-binding domain-containing protein [Ruminococcus sp.]|uniref:PstS family phosphate ABC transporter substrate-binding protein n=1 Tax=Ruminococcus sp. TaxID=41978 RepID=UPI0025F9D9C9|nr:substrate-binding domain-containing protein [Ruminococcus sp.]MCR5599499.1 substrate-binding domain-containing protein [Ruminococcus sp.]